MDPAIIASVIAGACGCGSLIVQKILDMKCVKNENFDGSAKNYHCIPRFNNCSLLIYPKRYEISSTHEILIPCLFSIVSTYADA